MYDKFLRIGVSIWWRRLLLALLFALVLLQLIFSLVQSQISRQAELAVSSLFTSTNAFVNPLYLSQSSAGLEASGLISCVSIKRVGDPVAFYESSFCSDSHYLSLFLMGEKINLVIPAVDGHQWEVKFLARNGLLFYLALWALRAVAVLFICSIFIWHESRIRNIERVESLKSMSALALADQAAQVAHDIRSPLAALDVILKLDGAFSLEARQMATNAAIRIRQIANDLLNSNQAIREKRSELLVEVLKDLYSEKKAQYLHEKAIILSLRIEGNMNRVVATAPASELKRVVSNLVNNAVEATERGEIIVSASLNSPELVSIEVIDSGAGIPRGLLGSIGKRGLTFGKSRKEAGSGLGLYYACSKVKEWGGVIHFESETGKGTKVSILIPVELRPTPQSDRFQSISALLLDNDALVHELWGITGEKRNQEWRGYFSPDALITDLKKFSSDIPIYIDLDLGPEHPSGIEVAKQIFEMGYRNLYLATGKNPDGVVPATWIKAVVGKEPPWL